MSRIFTFYSVIEYQEYLLNEILVLCTSPALRNRPNSVNRRLIRLIDELKSLKEK